MCIQEVMWSVMEPGLVNLFSDLGDPSDPINSLTVKPKWRMVNIMLKMSTNLHKVSAILECDDEASLSIYQLSDYQWMTAVNVLSME